MFISVLSIKLKPKSEVLVLANKSGLVQTIFLDGNPKSKKIKGPSFLLDLRTKAKGSNSNLN